jgi:large subunit ribosomal protein L34e
MTKPSQRTHGRRRKAVTLPSGRRTLHFLPRAHSKPTCSRCGSVLQGVISSRGSPSAASLRVPNRPFAGVLCHKCLSSEIRSRAHPTGTSD